MKQLCAYYDITRQAHHEDGRRRRRRAGLRSVYLGLMAECRAIHPRMGLRKMYLQLQPEGIGRDAWIVLGMQDGYRLEAPNNPRRTTYAAVHRAFDNLLKDRRVSAINQVWVSDLFYLEMAHHHLYVVLIMDLYSRRVVGSAGGDHMRAELFTKALRRALTLRGIDDYTGELIHHSDRGSQYTSRAYTDLLTDHGIRISRCATVLENAHAERLNGSLKNEYLRCYEGLSPVTIDRRTQQGAEAYNERYHNSLQCSPLAFEEGLADLSDEARKTYDVHVYTEENTQKMNNPGQLSLF